MEAIITVVGFLGAGKTTLLKHLIEHYIDNGWDPFVILNDYENANIDAQQFKGQIETNQLRALSGSCICCSGINELREFINRIPKRNNGITLIEANGTSDACSLMGFLGVGINDRFLPPIQISVVDVKNWQKRAEHNDLEANQIQVSSLIVLTHVENETLVRISDVISELKKLNPTAEIIKIKDIDVSFISNLSPSKNNARKFEHLKSHWSSCSANLPVLPNSSCVYDICSGLPKSILRVKGCAQVEKEEGFIYFERTPDGVISVRPFNGVPITGSKLLSIGPGSNPEILEKAIEKNIKEQYR